MAASAGVSLASRTASDDAQPQSRDDERRGIAWSLDSAVLLGLFLVELDVGAEHSLMWTLIAARVAGLATIIPWAARQPRRPAEIRAQWRPLVAVGLFSATAAGLYGVGVNTGLVSIVAMSSSLHSVVTALLAAWLLRERLSRTQLSGVVLATIAVAAMASDT